MPTAADHKVATRRRMVNSPMVHKNFNEYFLRQAMDRCDNGLCERVVETYSSTLTLVFTHPHNLLELSE